MSEVPLHKTDTARLVPPYKTVNVEVPLYKTVKARLGGGGSYERDAPVPSARELGGTLQIQGYLTYRKTPGWYLLPESLEARCR